MRGKFDAIVVLPSSRWPRAMVRASPRSICAPDDPRPEGRRQNWKCAEAVLVLLRIKSSANSRSSGFGLSSSTLRPLTMAPTDLRPWQTREQTAPPVRGRRGRGRESRGATRGSLKSAASAGQGEHALLARFYTADVHAANLMKGGATGKMSFIRDPPTNQACSRPPVIDSETAARLMAALTTW